MARLDVPALEKSAFDKMPSGWVNHSELRDILTQDELSVVTTHAIKQQTLFVPQVNVTSNDPIATELQIKKVEGV